MFSGQIGAAEETINSLTHEQFLKVFSDGSGFTSGCGIEYPTSLLVQAAADAKNYPVTGKDYLRGALKPGRRLLDVVVRRYADANIRHLQDDFLSTGRYRLLVLASSDLLQPSGQSATALTKLCSDVIPEFPADTVELVVVHPIRTKRFEWTDIPSCVKQYAEMRFHGMADEEVYRIYGVAEEDGAVVIVRPDGYVGTVVALSDVERAKEYLAGCLVSV